MSRFWDIIPHSFRRRTLGVVMTIFLRAILNFVGVATLIPILILIVDSSNIATTGYLSWLYNALHIDSYQTFSIVVCLGVIAIITLKNIAVVYLYRFERDYIYSLYKHLSQRLYESYYRKGLGFIKHSNTAILTRNVNVVSLIFATNILKPIATIIGEGLLMLLMFVALVLYSPIIALIAVGLFLPIVALFYFSMRKRLNTIGDRENVAQRAKGRIVAETFRGYADIEINNAFPLTKNNFNKAIDEAVKLRKEYATIGMLPQMFTEVGLAIGLTVIIIVSLYSSSDNLVILLGIFAIAGVRLLPSLRTIMASWSSIRYNRYTIDTLREADIHEEQTTAPVTAERFNFERSIELRDLEFKFEDSDTPLFSNLSFTINKGERVGITGASGVGKTTLFNIILGLYRPTSGAIYIDGEKLSEENIRKWQNSIGYVSQSVFIADSTLVENIALGCDSDSIDLERIRQVIELADLTEFVSSLPNGIDSRIGEQGSKISGGQRQRIGIARALYKNSDILFFDEATSSLDNKTEENINNAIQNLSMKNASLTIVIIAHRESSLEYCDRIITLE
ncbi:MAG: ABC transporter ATP-binding protein [Alistipes sp.]|nr:ABC transporter ATP-binding protein [Alistipes sp.]